MRRAPARSIQNIPAIAAGVRRGAAVVVVLLGLGCARQPFQAPTVRAGHSAAPGDEVAARWLRALAVGDLRTVRRLTALPFTFRTTANDKRCEGRVSREAELASWLECVRHRPELQELAKVREHFGPVPLEQGRAEDLVVHYGRAASQEQARREFDVLEREPAPGSWLGARGNWLYTYLDFHLLVIGLGTSPRVATLLMDLHRFPD